jgi:hypothetical protein
MIFFVFDIWVGTFLGFFLSDQAIPLSHIYDGRSVFIYGLLCRRVSDYPDGATMAPSSDTCMGSCDMCAQHDFTYFALPF